jgi:hypothetical protein
LRQTPLRPQTIDSVLQNCKRGEQCLPGVEGAVHTQPTAFVAGLKGIYRMSRRTQETEEVPATHHLHTDRLRKCPSNELDHASPHIRSLMACLGIQSGTIHDQLPCRLAKWPRQGKVVAFQIC